VQVAQRAAEGDHRVVIGVGGILEITFLLLRVAHHDGVLEHVDEEIHVDAEGRDGATDNGGGVGGGDEEADGRDQDIE
jgi:hypothetical protein